MIGIRLVLAGLQLSETVTVRDVLRLPYCDRMKPTGIFPLLTYRYNSLKLDPEDLIGEDL